MSLKQCRTLRKLECQFVEPINDGIISQKWEEKIKESKRIFCRPLLQAPPNSFQRKESFTFLILIINPYLSIDLYASLHSYILMIYNYHLLFKYIIVGDPSVGKSSLLLRFIDNKFTENYESTLGVEFGSKVITVGSTVVKTMIWDTAGQESFKSIIRSYYKNSIVALLVFDITSTQSFQNLQKWLEEIKNNATEHIRIVLVGNKADLFERRTVRKQVAQEFANTLGMTYFETSAKSGNNVVEVFTEPARLLISDIENKRLVVNSSMESMGIKIGNPELRSSEKASIQISIQNTKKQGCKC